MIWFLLASIFIVPISGAFSSNPWVMQSDVLYLFMAMFTIMKISSLNEHYRWLVLKALIALVILQGILVVLQYFNLDPLFNSLKNPGVDLPFGFSGSPNQSGVFFGTTLPLVAGLFPLALPLSLFGLLCAKTTSAWIGAMAGIALMSPKRTRKYMFMLIVVASILFFARFETVSDGALKERELLYRSTLKASMTGVLPIKFKDKIKLVKWNPFFGAGLGSFKRLSPHNQSLWIDRPNARVSHRYMKAHNDYLQIFFENGWLGITTVCMFLLIGLYRYIQAKKTKMLMIVSSCLVVQLISSLGIFTVHTATSGMLLVIFTGLFIGETNARGSTEATRPSNRIRK